MVGPLKWAEAHTVPANSAMQVVRRYGRRDLTNCTLGRDRSRSPLRKGVSIKIHDCTPLISLLMLMIHD